MIKFAIIFPHQLFENHPIIDECKTIYLVEEFLFFSQYNFHKQKLVFHRASMKAYQKYLEKKGKEVIYIESISEFSDIRKLIKNIAKKTIEQILYIDPTDFLLHKRLSNALNKADIPFIKYENPLFLNNTQDLSSFFKPNDKKYFQTSFYKRERIIKQLLVNAQGEPEGNKWSFDEENRKKYPKQKTIPKIIFPKKDAIWEEANEYVANHFSNNIGQLESEIIYPFTHALAQVWFNQFLASRFSGFGDFEDAIVSDAQYLHHSVLSPMLNIGLILPEKIVEDAITYARKNDIAFNNLEGFIRQIIGWREFIRGVYEAKGVISRTKNFWGFKRKIPKSFYEGTTGILPVDITIKKILKTGYCHHIERLMVLGNFMLLCEFDPDEVYLWFMELFIDAYDWVMVPNVYGMSQFADGGIFASKPYISGSNYLFKMSDYPKGDWQNIWDGLFWRFMHVHRSFFLKNPRLGMLVNNFDKMAVEKRQNHLEKATNFLKSLDNS